MAVSAQRITVSTTAVALNTDADTVGGTTLVIKNMDATATNAVDLGPSTVAAGGGFEVAGGAMITLELGIGDQVYAIRGTGAAADPVLSVLRIG